MSRAENNLPDQPLKELLDYGVHKLKQAGIDNPVRESRMLMAHALDMNADRLFAIRHSSQDVPALKFREYVARRCSHEPMAFITGVQGFWSLDLQVSPATLIPRPDSEAILTCLTDILPDRGRAYSILDLGTGTGCLLLAALDEYPAAWGLGGDINPDAALLAAKNAQMCALSDRAFFMAGCWDNAIEKQKFDVVISNPPYIPTDDLPALMPDVRLYEPVAALDGGADGMQAYSLLCRRLPFLLSSDGVAIFEIGIHQLTAFQKLAAESGLETVRVQADLAGIPRAVALKVRA